MDKLKVHYSTDHDRVNSKDDYIVAINPKLKNILKVGNHCVIVNTILYKDQELKFNAHGRVVTSPDIPMDTCRVDQTITSAIGIPMKYDVEKQYMEIFPLRLSILQNIADVFSRLNGRRYLFLRITKSEVADLEKNISRISSDAFQLLGTQFGKKIVIESPVFDKERNQFTLLTHSVNAFELYYNLLENRKKSLETNMDARYIDSEKVIGVSPDISQIWIDAEGYNKIGAKILTPIKVRRGFRDLYVDEFRTTGIISFLTLFTILSILPVDIKNWLSIIENSFVILSITSILIFINIRTMLK